MANIIAARFDTAERADGAIQSLENAGCPRAFIETFYVSPAGQHATTSIGGDSYSDAGAKNAGAGGVTGAVAGGTAGLALGAALAIAVPVVGPIAALAGAGIGAYTGSLAGAMSQTTDGQDQAPSEEHPVPHTGGPMVAVHVAPSREAEVVRILRDAGGHDLERANGDFRDGKWIDFDPVGKREPLEAPIAHGETPRA